MLEEIRSLGLLYVEAGPVGYLGADAASIRGLLDAHALSLVGGFLPVVLHDRAQFERTLASAQTTAALYAAAGGRVLVSACVVDVNWSPRIPLDDRDWRTLLESLERVDEVAAANGLMHVLHPHVGTLVETADDVARVLEDSEVKLCLDTGHLTIGGADPVAIARDAGDRVGHVHLKDVRSAPAAEVRAGRLTLLEATRRGLFCPLGDSDAAIYETVRVLEQAGYTGWYVLEQDAALDENALPAPGAGPIEDTRRSLEFLRAFLDGGDPVGSSLGREVGRTH